MAKILINISNYGIQQIDFLQEVVANFQSWSIEKKIVIDTSIDLSNHLKLAHNFLEQRIFDPKIGHKLPFSHRGLFANEQKNFDYFLYTENDLLISENAIKCFENAKSILEEDEILGFIRFENYEHSKYLTDFDFKTPISKFPAWKQKNIIFFSPEIQHSGCYLIDKKQLAKAIKSGGYLVKPHTKPYGMLEQGASDIYTQCGFKPKFIPIPYSDVLVHHLPNKYVQMKNGLARHLVSLLDEFITFIATNKPQIDVNTPPPILDKFLVSLRYQLNSFERRIRHKLKKTLQ